MILRILTIVAVLLSLPAAQAAAQTPRDQIAAGYELLHRGDAAAATRHFETLQKTAQALIQRMIEPRACPWLDA